MVNITLVLIGFNIPTYTCRCSWVTCRQLQPYLSQVVIIQGPYCTTRDPGNISANHHSLTTAEYYRGHLIHRKRGSQKVPTPRYIKACLEKGSSRCNRPALASDRFCDWLPRFSFVGHEKWPEVPIWAIQVPCLLVCLFRIISSGVFRMCPCIDVLVGLPQCWCGERSQLHCQNYMPTKDEVSKLEEILFPHFLASPM